MFFEVAPGGSALLPLQVLVFCPVLNLGELKRSHDYNTNLFNLLYSFCLSRLATDLLLEVIDHRTRRLQYEVYRTTEKRRPGMFRTG